MEQAITALIIITLLLFGVLTLAQTVLNTQQQFAASWVAMEERMGERARTSLMPIRASSAGHMVEVTIKNSGGARLADFSHWDLFLQYDTPAGRSVGWYPYGAAPGSEAEQWSVLGIYLDAANGTPEIVEPGILDPGEEMVIRVKMAQPVRTGGAGVATVATPNGISISIAFTE